MGFEDLSPRVGLVVGLLALFPVIWYAFGSSATAGMVSGINVLIILTVLYVAFGPASNGHGSGASEHGSGASEHGSGSDGQESA